MTTANTTINISGIDSNGSYDPYVDPLSFGGFTNMASNQNNYSMGNVTIGGGGGSYTYAPSQGILSMGAVGAGANWTSSSSIVTTGTNHPSIKVTGDAEFDGDVKIGGKSIVTLLEKIEERLSILQPDPKRLARYEALQEAYEHYKTLEALCVEDNVDRTKK